MLEKADHCGSSNSKPLGDSGNSDSLAVKFKNFVNRKIVGWALFRSLDVRVMQDVSDDVFGRTKLAGNILNGYAAQIKVDNIVAIDVKFSFTHVYNLETKNNWYVANGIITHNCRCILVPYFNIDDTRASKDGYVDSKVTFSDWLGEQDSDTQLEVLGRTRFELFRRGEPISQFVDNGAVLDLPDLNARLLKEKNIDIQTYFRHNVSEPDITKLSDHVKARLKERNVRLDDIYDALSNPLYVGDVRATDAAYQVIGANATVGVSAFDGAITTCWKTGKSAIYKIKKGKMK